MRKCRTLQYLTMVIYLEGRARTQKSPKCVCNTFKALTWDNAKQSQIGTKSCTPHILYSILYKNKIHRHFTETIYTKLSQRLKTKIKQKKNTLKNKTKCQGKWFWQYIDVSGKCSLFKNYEVKFITLLKNKTGSNINVKIQAFSMFTGLK